MCKKILRCMTEHFCSERYNFPEINVIGRKISCGVEFIGDNAKGRFVDIRQQKPACRFARQLLGATGANAGAGAGNKRHWIEANLHLDCLWRQAPRLNSCRHANAAELYRGA